MNNTNIIVALDNGHGTHLYMKGAKQSPDGSLYEGEYAREIVDLIIEELTKLNIKTYKVTPEDSDIKLNDRVKRINALYKTNKVISISVHCNAAGADGKWHDAKGWSVFVAQNASSNSKKLATCLYNNAKELGLKVRVPLPTQPYWVLSLAMCRDTNCPAILTENLFQDNKEDVEFLLSDEGKKKIVDLHVLGILNYING